MDAHDAQALAHYQALIALYYPPTLAAALAAARYQAGLETKSAPPLPVLREVLADTAVSHPDLKRDIGRTVAAIDRRETVNSTNNRKR